MAADGAGGGGGAAGWRGPWQEGGVGVVEWLGEQGPNHCGYCGARGSRSAGSLVAHRLSAHQYQALLERGWRRSGSYVYKPDMARTCCPQYTIRQEATAFRPSKGQRRDLRRFAAEVNGEGAAGGGAPGGAPGAPAAPAAPAAAGAAGAGADPVLNACRGLLAAAARSLGEQGVLAPGQVSAAVGGRVSRPSGALARRLAGAGVVASSPVAFALAGMGRAPPAEAPAEGGGGTPNRKRPRGGGLTDEAAALAAALAAAAEAELGRDGCPGAGVVSGVTAGEGFVNFVAGPAAATGPGGEAPPPRAAAGGAAGGGRPPRPGGPGGAAGPAGPSMVGVRDGRLVVGPGTADGWQSVFDAPVPGTAPGAPPAFEVRVAPSAFVDEEFDLYRRYQAAVHGDDPDDLSPGSYRRFLVDTPLPPPGPAAGGGDGAPRCGYGSFHMQYRLHGKLVAVGVVDVLPRCLSR